MADTAPVGEAQDLAEALGIMNARIDLVGIMLRTWAKRSSKSIVETHDSDVITQALAAAQEMHRVVSEHKAYTKTVIAMLTDGLADVNLVNAWIEQSKMIESMLQARLLAPTI